MNDLNNQSHGTSKVDTTGFSDTGFLTQRGVLVQARMMAHDRLFHKGGTGAKSLMENRVAGWATCKGAGWCKVVDGTTYLLPHFSFLMAIWFHESLIFKFQSPKWHFWRQYRYFAEIDIFSKISSRNI